MKLLGIIIGILVSIICIGIVLWNVNYTQLGIALGNAYWQWVFLSACCSVIQMWLRSQRWQRILKPSKEIPLSTAFRSYMIGQMANMVLPFRAGELIRVLALDRLVSVSKSACLASVVTERILDLFSLLLMLGLTVLLFPLPEWISNSAWGILILATGSTISLLIIKKTQGSLAKIASKLERILPKSIVLKFSNILESFLSGLKGLGSIKQYFCLGLETVTIWLLAGLSIYFLFIAFNMVENYDLAFLATLVMVVMTALGVSVPSSPGFVGTIHLAIVMGLSLFGVAKEEALGYAVVLHFLSVFVIVTMGIISLRGGVLSFRSLYISTNKNASD